MSKGGGAGKVYFVLYLAVILELLIIIVERDEAEESLLKKQRETMKIVESILSQLQSGAGTEGINTRPQDEITIPPADINVKEVLGADIKSYRKYIVEVGVTDVAAELQKMEGEQQVDYAKRLDKLIKLGNVEEITYQIFFNSSQDPNKPPDFLTDKEIKDKGLDFMKFEPGQTIVTDEGETWEFLSLKKLQLDARQIMNNISDFNAVDINTINPVYPPELMVSIGSTYAPQGKEDSVFYYLDQEELQKKSETLLKRSFEVYFQPPRKSGWYKLRFASRTNRILGIHGDVKANNIPDDASINIGTVSLTAKDLKKVMKQLNSQLDKYNPPTFEMLAIDKDLEGYEKQLEAAKALAAKDDNPTETLGKIRLYNYIIKLLTPNMSINFAQNKGAIEFNVRVILPEVKSARPILSMPTYTPTFDKLPGAFEFTASPWMGNNVLDGKVLDATNSIVARVNFTPVDEIDPDVVMPSPGQKRDYRGIIDQTLSPGKYEMVVVHRIGGQEKEERGVLEVFPTGLTKDNNNLVGGRLSYLFYGAKFPPLTLEPSSGGKIKPENFRIYITTDKNTQTAPIEGLSITDQNSTYLDCSVNSVMFRLTWIQPYTNKELDIYPMTKKSVMQAKPRINTNDKQITIDDLGANKIRVTIRNLKIVAPKDGKAEGSKARLTVGIGKTIKLGKLEDLGVFQSGEPYIEESDGTYRVMFELKINPPRGVDEVKGVAMINVTATAVNNCNSAVNSTNTKGISVPIKYEPKSGGRGGSRRSGGSSRPSGGSRRR